MLWGSALTGIMILKSFAAITVAGSTIIPHPSRARPQGGTAFPGGGYPESSAPLHVESRAYNEDDFCRRMDRELFPLLGGTPACGPGGYTSQSIRDAWRKRMVQGLPWGRIGGHADTTEAIERTLVIAVRYARDPHRLAVAAEANTRLTQIDDTVVSMTVAFGATLGLLVQGEPLDKHLSRKLMALVQNGDLPFHTVTGRSLSPPRPGDPDPPREGRFASPDALLTPSYMAAASSRPGKCRWSTVCLAPFTTFYPPAIILQPGSGMILNRRFCMPSTAAGKTRPALF
jgi:ADP-ribosylglycohydrolase